MAQVCDSIRNLSRDEFVKMLTMFVESNFNEHDRKTHIDMRLILRFFQFGTHIPRERQFFEEKGLRDIWNDAHFQRQFYLEAVSRYHEYAGDKNVDVETT